MAPLYSGSADEWSYISHDTSNSQVKTIDFLIDNFEAEMKKGGPNLKSNPFTLKHTLWHIEVNPASKHEKDGRTCVGVFVYNDNPVNLRVNCKFVIGGQQIERLVNQEITPGGWAGIVGLSHEDCRKRLVEGKFKVGIEIKLIQEEKTVICGAKSNNVLETSNVVNKIHETMSFPDFKVICNGKVFPCHKTFLATGSSVFKNMLEANMEEANDGSVEIQNHNDIVIENFVKFFYTNHVKDEVLKNYASNFLDLGEQYQMLGLKKMAELAMIANLSTENMLKYFIAGDMYHATDIKEAAKVFIRKNRRSLVEQEGWRDVVTDRGLLLDLIESLSKE